jgi:hypothetical protein
MATSDANFGIKGAPAIFYLSSGFEFEVPITNLPPIPDLPNPSY